MQMQTFTVKQTGLRTRSPVREKEGLYGQGRIKFMMGKPTETTDLNTWKLMDSGSTASDSAWA